MKRATSLGYLSAIALLASGGIDRAYSDPFAPGDLDAQGVPRASLVEVPSQRDLVSRWQLPASNPWAAYEKLTLLSVVGGSPETVALPHTDGLEEVQLARLAAARVAHDGVPTDAMWVIDLRGAASVAFGAALSRDSRETVAVVPTFNNWPFEDELVPAEEALSAMIHDSPYITSANEGNARPVFLLDSWRLAYKDETIDDDVVDNRYMLSPADFPNPEKLRAYGIRHVIYVVPDAEEYLYEEDDLNALFLMYQAAGIQIHMLDLPELTAARDDAHAPDLYYDIAIHSYVVVPRPTCVHNPEFYQRARGGFGGVHGAPTVWSPAYLANGGGGWGWSGHGGG